MKNVLFISAALICILSAEAFSQAWLIERDGTCSPEIKKEIFENATDTIALQKALKVILSHFEDKPKFDSTKFIVSCLTAYGENEGGSGGLGDMLGSLMGGAPSEYAKEAEKIRKKSLFVSSIEKSDPDMFLYVLRLTKGRGINPTALMNNAIKIFMVKKTSNAAKIVKILQQSGAIIDEKSIVNSIIKAGDLETIKALHENGINLQGDCKSDFCDQFPTAESCRNYSCRNPIGVAAEHSKKIYQYLSEQGYKTAKEQKAAEAKIQRGQDDEEIKKQIEEITKLLKSNKLAEGIVECSELNYKVSPGEWAYKGEISKEYIQKYNDLCAKQLVGRVRKLPKNKIK